LNTTTASLYSNAFTNANACIYLQLGSASQTVSEPVTMSYSAFRTALTAAETDTNDTVAVTASVPATNPYAGDSVRLTNPLARALGSSATTGIQTNGQTPCALGTAGCYDAVITISNTAPFYLRSGTIASGQIDFFTLVERQTDEALGTASCSPSACGANVAPADFFRYHSNGTRSFAPGTNDACSSSDSTNACFSFDGVHMLQQYNNLSGGQDTGDWAPNCASNPLVQDAPACPTVADIDISPAAEILVLDVVGYAVNLTSSVSIHTNPEGLQFSVDGGMAQTAPQTLSLAPGTHTIAVLSTQAGGVPVPGTQYVFTGWSDGGAASHTITAASNSAATYTASFNTQYQLTIAASPGAGGTVTPASGTYYNAGAAAALTATANSGYSFSGWTGAVANTSSASTTVTMSGPESITANFSLLTGITIQTSPSGLQFTVNGGPVQIAPQTLSLSQGTYTIALAATQAGGAGTQYVFSSWSDGDSANPRTITVGSSAATYVATFTVQYLLTTAVSPAGSGTVTATPTSSGYYNAGVSVQLTASPNGTYQLSNWSGDLSGSTNPQSITMNAPHTVTADFDIPSCSITLTPSSTALPATGTSTVEVCPNNSGQPNCGVYPETPLSFTVTPSAACGTWTATSSSPGFLQILAGGAGGSGVGTVTFAQLANTHNGQQSNAITVTSGGTAATYTVTEAGSGDSQTYREVYALYEQLLGRDPDSGGFAFWTGVGGAGLGQMADSFLTSPEAFNTDFAVMAAYQAATGSGPTYAQYTAAAASIRAGGQTVPGLFNSLIGSGYSAATLYQNLLNRAPGAADSGCIGAGLAACFQTIVGYPANTTPVSALNNEFQSTGTYHTTLAADHTNALYMQMVYFVTLDRDPDPSGFAFWVGIANQGGPGLLFQGSAGYFYRNQILGPGTPNQGFIGSPEFQGLFAN
jgi:hypothetical protein